MSETTLPDQEHITTVEIGCIQLHDAGFVLVIPSRPGRWPLRRHDMPAWMQPQTFTGENELPLSPWVWRCADGQLEQGNLAAIPPAQREKLQALAQTKGVLCVQSDDWNYSQLQSLPQSLLLKACVFFEPIETSHEPH